MQKGDEMVCPGGRGEWSLSLYDCRQILFNGNTNFVWSTENIQEFGSCEGIISYLSNRWINIVVTKDFDIYKIFFNGELKQEANGELICGNVDPTNFGELLIGKDFNGIVDDIMIFDRVITNSEIVELNNSEGCCD